MGYLVVAQRFGDCIAKKDYGAAWALLSNELQA
jgi:hypothetical protein